MIPKFRVWDSGNKRWVNECFYISTDGLTWRLGTDDLGTSNIMVRAASGYIFSFSNNYLDINDKEFYEGDIVEWALPDYDHDEAKDGCTKAREEERCPEFYGEYKTEKERLRNHCFDCPYCLINTGIVVRANDGYSAGLIVKDIDIQDYWGFYGPESQNFSWSDLKIIGNKWEHPEMLP